MKMRKWMLTLAAVLLAATVSASALAQEADDLVASAPEAAVEQEDQALNTRFDGEVVSVDLDAGEMLIAGTHMGDVLVRFDAQIAQTLPPLYEGVQVSVETTGVATMSLPAQVNALSIQVHVLMGTVTGFEDGMLLFETDLTGVMAAHITHGPSVYGLEHVAVGAKVSAYYDGILTRSIPAQLTPHTLVFEAAGDEE